VDLLCPFLEALYLKVLGLGLGEAASIVELYFVGSSLLLRRAATL